MTSFDPPFYAVRDVVTRALAEDLGVLGDLTAVLVPPDAHAVAEIVARHDGVLAGAICAALAARVERVAAGHGGDSNPRTCCSGVGSPRP